MYETTTIEALVSDAGSFFLKSHRVAATTAQYSRWVKERGQ